MSRLILLHEADNVLVCGGAVRAGSMLTLDGREVTAGEDVEVGHKLARRGLRAGEKVVKHGAPIGSMTRDAAAGAHVHLHNMRSDYIASHDRRAADAAGR